MSEGEPIELGRIGRQADQSAPQHRAAWQAPLIARPRSAAASPSSVSFDRRELREIFALYGRKVAEGEWRDYAIDFRRDRAVFTILRRAWEAPIYRIEKDPKGAPGQNNYSVIAATGLVLKRGPELARVIAVLDKRLKLVIA